MRRNKQRNQEAASQRQIVAELDVLKRLEPETAAELDALLPAILDLAFKGEL